MDEDRDTTAEAQNRAALAAERNGAANRARTPQAPGSEPRPRISLAERGLFISVAGLFDAAQAVATLLVVGTAISSAVSVIAWLTFFLWLKMKGVSFGLTRLPSAGGAGAASLLSSPLIVIAAASGIELIPFINALPTWTAAVTIALLRL